LLHRVRRLTDAVYQPVGTQHSLKSIPVLGDIAGRVARQSEFSINRDKDKGELSETLGSRSLPGQTLLVFACFSMIVSDEEASIFAKAYYSTRIFYPQLSSAMM